MDGKWGSMFYFTRFFLGDGTCSPSPASQPFLRVGVSSPLSSANLSVSLSLSTKITLSLLYISLRLSVWLRALSAPSSKDLKNSWEVFKRSRRENVTLSRRNVQWKVRLRVPMWYSFLQAVNIALFLMSFFLPMFSRMDFCLDRF